MFETSADIGNRACQHCGVPRMDPTLGFSEGTERANEIGFAYGKVKRAALRRNVWQFSIRAAALRPIDTNTMLVLPAMWASTTTYFKGSLVSDATGFPWQSRIGSNLNNQLGQPGAIFAWEPYFGPLTVSAYDPTEDYFAGELVYLAPGDGTYNVYLSLISGNAVDPSLPNQWSATTTFFKNQVVQVYPAWAIGTTYAQGATVTYTDGNTYSSLTSGNVGNAPATSPTSWALVPVLILQSQQVPEITAVLPPTSSPIIEWNIGTVYSSGFFVLFNGTAYLSIANNNTGNYPNAAASVWWVPLSGGTLYMSLTDLNINNNPASAPALWSATTTYATGNKVGGSDGQIYTSVGNGNLDNNPVTDGGVHWTASGVLNPWTTVFTLGAGNSQWLQVGGSAFPFGVALTTLDIVYPLGSGPLSQEGTRNVYRLPAGWLREAPQDPKAGSTSSLGAPSGLQYSDWEYRGNYFTSWCGDAIVYWFAADVVDVTEFDDMFCEMLGYDVALAVVDTLTQSAAKHQEIELKYEKYRDEAQTVNGVNLGAVEPAMDDFLSCRY